MGHGPNNMWFYYCGCDAASATWCFHVQVDCTALTVCNADTQLEMSPPTTTSDRQCGGRPAGLLTWQIAAIVVAVTVLFGTVLGSRVYQKHKKQRLAKDLDLYQRLLHDERAEKQTLYAENVEMKRAWEINEEDLCMEKELAAGAFGAVWRARWGHVPVAVKMLKHAVDSECAPSPGRISSAKCRSCSRRGIPTSSFSTALASLRGTFRSWSWS